MVGKWDCVGTDDAGQATNWTLVVKDDGGKLAGTLSGDPGEFQLVDAKLDGDSFTFKICGERRDLHASKASLDGKTVEGKYKGPEGGGTIKGTKAS